MKLLKPVALAATVVASALLAYGLFTLPKARPADYDGFSAGRVLNDLEVISMEHHSVAQPIERARVREYLVGRLGELGADTVRIFRYDSLVGPQNKHVEYTFDAYDVLAEFAPASRDSLCTWLLLVAHYDSRFSQPMPKDTVWSYGAADDGYGVGVILETVNQLLKERECWNQGVKVLFTDAEEPGMWGMKSIWANNREEFDNVGLMLNIEARGPWGPALLFEACPGNRKILDLYAREAKYPYTYSLTTVVYSFMPNFTDFTIVKNDIPGMNFSTIADVNHYHTDLDNFSNVSARSVQHYGAQVLPVALEYVTNPQYADKDALRADTDTTNFTVPLIGLVNMSKTAYLVINILVVLLFAVLLLLGCRSGKVRLRTVLGTAGLVLAAGLGILALGEGIAWLCALFAGAKFVPFGVTVGIMSDNTVMIVSVVLMILVSVFCYGRSTRRNTAEALFGALLLDAVLGLALVLALGENLMFFIPLFCSAVALLLAKLTGWRFWLPLGMAVVLLHAFSFLYALAMALTIGAFGAVAMFAFFDLMVLIPMADLFLSDRSLK